MGKFHQKYIIHLSRVNVNECYCGLLQYSTSEHTCLCTRRSSAKQVIRTMCCVCREEQIWTAKGLESVVSSTSPLIASNNKAPDMKVIPLNTIVKEGILLKVKTGTINNTTYYSTVPNFSVALTC